MLSQITNAAQVPNLAKAIDRSPQRLEAFKRLQMDVPAVTLPKDVFTRWKSTFLLIVRAL